MPVEWWATLKVIVVGTKSIHSFVHMETLISRIRKELNQIYSDVATANFEAAQFAFKAAGNSRNAEQEVRSGIGHLRAAYFTYEKLLTKMRTTNFLFFKSEKPVLDDSSKQQVMEKLAEIANMISLSYNELGERENANEWKQFASKYFGLSEKVFFEALRRNLEAIEEMYPEYVRNVRKKWASRSGVWLTYYEMELTSLGERCLDKRLKELKKERAQSFDAIFIAQNII